MLLTVEYNVIAQGSAPAPSMAPNYNDCTGISHYADARRSHPSKCGAEQDQPLHRQQL